MSNQTSRAMQSARQVFPTIEIERSSDVYDDCLNLDAPVKKPDGINSAGRSRDTVSPRTRDTLPPSTRQMLAENLDLARIFHLVKLHVAHDSGATVLDLARWWQRLTPDGDYSEFKKSYDARVKPFLINSYSEPQDL